MLAALLVLASAPASGAASPSCLPAISRLSASGACVHACLCTQVEPLEREVEQVQVIALSSALKAGVRVVHLDRSGGPLNHHDFPDGEAPAVHLLYRPGHYDLIYL